MIDCENEVFTRIAVPLRESIKGIHVTSEYMNAPSAFPHVSVVMSDNALAGTDSDFHEIAVVMFEINIYSNLTNGRKSQCRKITGMIDAIMFHMNFTRIAMTPVPNMQDASIYRIAARYRAATDGTFFYRR